MGQKIKSFGHPRDSQQNLMFYSNFSRTIALSVGVLAMVFLIGYFVLAWTEPPYGGSCTNPPCPPGGNVPTPLNVGPAGQSKSGGLILGTGCVPPCTIGLIVDKGNVGIGTTTPNNLLSVYDLIDFNNTDLNTKIGYQAGKNIAGGAQKNTFVGYQAGFASSIANADWADENSAFGYRSLFSNTIGKDNSAMGTYALYSNTGGTDNSAMGRYALYSNTTGSQNTAMGSDALWYNTTGFWNTAMGFGALYINATANGNTAMGYEALRANSIGNYNTATGYMALHWNTTGLHNTANGANTLGSNTQGWENSAMGMYALTTNTTGKYNSAMGFAALYHNLTGSNNVALGYYAGHNETGSNTFYVDNQDRIDTAGEKAKSLMYGVFAALPADQKLTINANVGIGTTAPGYKLDVNGSLRLQPSSAPANANGVIYYDSSTNKFRCYQNGSWTDCIGAAGGGITQLNQGTGIILSPNPITTTGSISADTTYLQRRVAGSGCAAGSSIRVINADGSVICEPAPVGINNCHNVSSALPRISDGTAVVQACDSGTMVSGGCFCGLPPQNELAYLYENRPSGNGWSCRCRMGYTVQTTARCCN